MNHALVTNHALKILDNPDSTRNQRDLAVAALVAAGELDLAPGGTAAALWQYILTKPSDAYVYRAADTIGTLLAFEPSILSGAITAVTTMETEADLFEASLQILTGRPYAAHVGPEVLLAICECSIKKSRRAARFIPQLIETIQDVTGGLPVEILRALRDGWSRSRIEEQRCEAPEIGRLIPTMDLTWLDTMLRDPSSVVRVSTAQVIRRMNEPEKALPLIDERIGSELHAEVLAALHDARVDINNGIERKARRALR